MKNNQQSKALKSGKRRIFPENLSCFILITFLILYFTSHFFSATHAKEFGVDEESGHQFGFRAFDIGPISSRQSGLFSGNGFESRKLDSFNQFKRSKLSFGDAALRLAKNSSMPFTNPEFYTFEQFRGFPFTPSSSEWKFKCVDLPFGSSFLSSLKTGGHCLFVCPEKNCQPESFGYRKALCQKVNPKTREISKLRDIGLNNKIKSFRRCSVKEMRESESAQN